MRLVALTIAALLGLAAAAPAATLEPIGAFDRPIFVTSAPADPDRLFVVEREGRLIEVGAGVVADISDLVSCCESERGLLSVAPAPDFAASARFFAAYTGNTAAGGDEGDIHVDAFRHDGGTLVREPILTIGHAAMPNHNGGQLQLGPDGYLYVSTGDGGGGGDPLGSGQSLATLLGKILRIEPRAGATAEIWSYGLRNPWRFSFDRLTGDMAIADVGQGLREEVDLAPSPAAGVVGGAGANYGWNCREGAIEYPSAPESCDGATGFTDPVFDYPHADPGGGQAHGCSITGGYVVRDASLGGLYGRYVYADFCIGEVRSLVLPATAGGRATDDRSEGIGVANPTSFGEDSCGRIYVVSNGGAVYRLVGEQPASCPGAGSNGQSGSLPSQAAFAKKGKRPLVRLRVASRGDGTGRGLLLTARVLPCVGQEGASVQLNRGGRRLAAKPLGKRCHARFRTAVARRATFRALLRGADGGTPVRSRRLVVSPGA